MLLTKPAEDGETDPVHPLNEISELYQRTFEKHRVAVTAVEATYKSMWRLTVYAAPEHMEKWENISDAVRRAIFKAAGEFHGNPCKDKPDGLWPNDEHLVRELSRKTEAAYVSPGAESDLSEFGEDLGRTVDGLLGSDGSAQFQRGYMTEAGLTEEGRKRLEAALIAPLNGAGNEAVNKLPMVSSRPRMDRVITTARIYIKRIGKRELESFRQNYTTIFNRLPPESFEALLSELNTAADNAKQLDEKSPSHQGAKFRQFVELVDEVLGKFGTLVVAGWRAVCLETMTMTRPGPRGCGSTHGQIARIPWLARMRHRWIFLQWPDIGT